MHRTTQIGRNRLRELAFSQLFALTFLAGCVWWVYHDLVIVIGSSKITVAEAWVQGQHSVLPTRLASFGLAVLGVHMALGLLAWVLARLTRAALTERATGGMPWLIAAWFLLIAFLTLAANDAWYTASRFASENSWLRGDWFGVEPVTVISVSTAVVVLTLAVQAIRRGSPRWPLTFRRLVVLAPVALALVILPTLDVTRSQASTPHIEPHIVILGVDSLRRDLAEVSDGHPLTPNIDNFLAGSHRFNDAVSPLARTYPAWVSILTGRHPVHTNARFNLMPRTMVDEGDTLADVLRARGYHAVYATDEVRFANIDESFGFDQVVAPPMGASDFLLGAVGDLPLVNLLAGSRIGRWLFPSNHANRAAHVTYRPEHFVARMDRELEIDGPSFLAIHLTLSHWPYSWAGQPMPTTPQEYRPAYRRAVEAVDRQVRDVLRLLERKRVLDNAIVVMLSDHGDALGYPSDSMLRNTGTSREIWDSLWGHGTSVMSPHQYSVLLALRAFGSAGLPGEAGEYDWPVTLEDVRPTLEELVTGRAPGGVDGVPLVPYFSRSGRTAALDSRIRFTETCFNTVKLMEGKVSASGLLAEGAAYFQIEPETGWVQLRPDRLDEIMSKKQRAALSRNSLLAAIPSWSDDTITYLFSSRQSPMPRRLSGRPDPQEDPEAVRLWDALQANFPGELPDDSDLARM